MRNLKQLLKRSKLIAETYDFMQSRIAFISGHLSDLWLSYRYAMPMSLASRGYRTRVLMLAHFLEKGMSYHNLRPFGHRHIKEMIILIELFNSKELESFEYMVALSALTEWIRLFEDNHWESEPLVIEVKKFLSNKPVVNEKVGVQTHHSTEVETIYENNSLSIFAKKILERHSVRDFAQGPLTRESLAFPLECMRAAPTACNRQPCRIYQIENSHMRQVLHKAVSGIGGLNKETLHYFIVTYDMSAFSGSGERNQGFLNAGLVTMNFVNGLHLSGFGSCLLQWQRKESYEKGIKESLGIPKNERIAVVVAVGHLATEYKVPLSARKPVDDLFKVIE